MADQQPCILVTGYGGWADHDTNPSALLAESVTGHLVGGSLRVVTGVLPVDWTEAPAELQRLISTHAPRAIVCLGLAGGCTGLRVERLAANLSNGTDNAELLREDAPLVEGGPDAHAATLPTREMLHAITAAGVPAALSMSAGTYLCNAAMYHAIHHGTRRGIPAGFIHIPNTPELVVAEAAARGDASVAQASMSLDTMRTGLVAALEAVASELALNAPAEAELGGSAKM